LARTRLLPLPRRQRAADRWGLARGGRPWERALEAGLAGEGFRAHAALLDGDLPLVGILDPIARKDVYALTSSGWLMSAGDELGRARRYDADVWMPNVFLEKTDRATMAGSLEARVPFLDREVVAAAGRTDPRGDTTKPALRKLLKQLLPGVRLPNRKKGLAINIRALVDAHFAVQVERQLADPESALNCWVGRPDDGRVRQRAARSPYLAFRLAMLDEWQTLFGNDLTWLN
jgi:asparagine synthetase B (glutamine-hydrolysing)